MPQLVATIDTSVLVSLQHAGLLAALSVQFDRVLVPAKVRSELRDGGERNKAALGALTDYSIFESCDDYDPVLVRLLLATRNVAKVGRDEGEAEAVVQASKRGANVVLTDDPLGRKWAANHSIECHGTIWVCRELRRTGYLLQLRPYFVKLIQSGCRQPLHHINEFLREFSEEEVAWEEYRRLIPATGIRAANSECDEDAFPPPEHSPGVFYIISTGFSIGFRVGRWPVNAEVIHKPSRRSGWRFRACVDSFDS